MATPPGPAGPGNPISFDDLRSETYITPNTNISLYLMGTYQYNDGFINNYTFFGNFYPLPSSPAGGPLTQNLSISMFYDIDTFTGTDCSWNSGSIPWVTDVTVSVSDSTNLSSGSNIGSNPQTSPLTIATFAMTPGTIGYQVEHWYSTDISVNMQGNQPPSPPFPPSTNANIQYDIGSGWTNFPGSPFNMGGIYTANNIQIPNGQTLYVRVN